MIRRRRRYERELVCLKVERVFDSCFQSDAVTISTTPFTIDEPSMSGFTFGCCTTAGPHALGTTIPDAYGCVNVLVTVPFTATFSSNDVAGNFAPIAGTCAAVATIYAPPGTAIQVSTTVDCGPPVMTTGMDGEGTSTATLTTVVTGRIFISSEAKVYLRVESRGYCKVPACSCVLSQWSPLFPAQYDPRRDG